MLQNILPGFVSAILPDYTLQQLISFSVQQSYRVLEIMCWPPGKAERRYAGVTHLDVSNPNSATFMEAKDIIKTSRVQISALGYYPNLLSHDEQEAAIARAHLMKVIHAASLLDIPVVTTFIGRNHLLAVEDNWPQFLKIWKPIITYAEEVGVKIAIENCPMLFTRDEWPGGKNLMTSPAIWERAFNDIRSDYFGLNFDPSHFIWQQMDYLKAMRDFQDKLFHLHAKDATLEREKLNQNGILAYPNDYHTPKLPGHGDVDWQAFFDVLQAIDYQGALCVEVEERAYETSEERRIEALKISREFQGKWVG